MRGLGLRGLLMGPHPLINVGVRRNPVLCRVVQRIVLLLLFVIEQSADSDGGVSLQGPDFADAFRTIERVVELYLPRLQLLMFEDRLHARLLLLIKVERLG